jgi:hypothetical protein
VALVSFFSSQQSTAFLRLDSAIKVDLAKDGSFLPSLSLAGNAIRVFDFVDARLSFCLRRSDDWIYATT